MKFLYARNHVVALARFLGEEAYVAVMSTSEEKQRIRLPLKAIGVDKLAVKQELFGKELHYGAADDKAIWMDVEPHQAYLLEL